MGNLNAYNAKKRNWLFFLVAQLYNIFNINTK